MLTASRTDLITFRQSEADDATHSTIARAAAMRAEAIRHQLARRDALAPVRSAWLRRAGELELASTVLWPQTSAASTLQRSA